jgi:hypothetical protein
VGDRSIHYEAAFEARLRERGLPYVSVDEAKRALFANARLKSFDFVVYTGGGPNLLVDIKGRSARGKNGGTTLQTWAGERDVEDLAEWERVFGEGFKAVLMFVYWVEAPLAPEPGLFEFRERWYRALGVDLHEYRNRMRRRSAKWKTVSLPTADFRSLARPLDSWLS